MSKLLHFFLDADMRCNHNGLKEFLKKKKIAFSSEDYIVFMNKRRNMIKMFCKGNEVIMHYRADKRIIDPGVIRYLPKYCDGKEMDVEGAIAEHLKDMLRRRGNSNLLSLSSPDAKIIRTRKKKNELSKL